jgi:hypothetical protein
MPKRYCLTCPYTDGCSTCPMAGDDRRFTLVPLSLAEASLAREQKMRRSERDTWALRVYVLAATTLAMTLLALL